MSSEVLVDGLCTYVTIHYLLVASDTHEGVKHMITLENTFAGYGEQSTQGVHVCINSANK